MHGLHTAVYICDIEFFFLKIKDRLPELKVIVKYIPESEEAIDPKAKEAGVLTWEEFMEAGKVSSCYYSYYIALS